MANEQMGMPAAAPSPDEMAVFDQMRQQISPKEFSDEMLAGASQADPQAVAQFKAELDKLDVPPEVLDALNNLVDEILANPDQYDAIRQKYMSQGIPEDILPEQFDPHFFAALNMAIDQLIAAPAGPQAFAKGGIAELKPISKAIAGYGRNGDTMLAHITPAEARMLKRRGGAGTTNPKTGLPEFFSLGSIFKGIGKAVKGFVNSTVGRIVTTVALGFFLGPAAASMMGVTSAAGVAAVSGFVGSAGSTLLGGGSIRDALKAGAIGGLTAGAVGGVTQGFDTAYTGPTTVGGQWDKLTGAAQPGIAPTSAAAQPGVTPEGYSETLAKTQAAVPGQPVAGNDVSAGIEPPMTSQAPGAAPVPPSAFDATATEGSLAKNLTPTSSNSLLDQAKDFYSNKISPSGIQSAAEPMAQKAGADAMQALQARLPNATPAMLEQAYQSAYKAAMPGVLGTYGPMVGAGLGIMGLTGGFSAKGAPESALKGQLMKPATQRIAEEGTQKQYYVQGLPGVQYDKYGAPTYGAANPLPTAGQPAFNMPGTIGGLGALVPRGTMYATPTGSIGSRKVYQPYNTADMYSNLLYPQQYAAGGPVQHFEEGGFADVVSTVADPVVTKAAEKTPEQLAAEKAAADALAAQQKASRDAKAQEKAMRRAAGYGTAYANINAGLSALAPENFPGAPVKLDAAREAEMRKVFEQPGTDIDYARVMQEKGYRPEEVAALTGRSFGDINRRYNTALRQDAYAPMLQGQRDYLAGIKGIYSPAVEPPVSTGQPPALPGQGGPGLTLPPVAPPVAPPVTTKPGVSDTEIKDYLAANPNLTDAQIRAAMDQYGVGVDQMAAVTGIPLDQIQQRYDMASQYTNKDIQDYLAANPNLTDAQIRGAMDQFGVGTAQMSAATGIPLDQIQQRYDTASQYTNKDIQDYLAANPNMTDAQIRGAMDQFGVGTAQMSAATGIPLDQIQQRYDMAGQTAPATPADSAGAGNVSIQGGLDQYGNLYGTQDYHYGRPLYEGLTASSSPTDIANAYSQFIGGAGGNTVANQQAASNYLKNLGITDATIGQAYNQYLGQPKAMLNAGGIAALAQGGYPRMNGQISGPGTEKSDSIPAMLSDGEFVMTAKAVRGMGKGSRREGAKRMYELMHRLEKNAARG